jgi:hypothetical protein
MNEGGEILALPKPIEQPRQNISVNEVKPSHPGALRDCLSENEKKPSQKVDYLMVFGQGPVLDKETMDKPDPNKKKVDNEAIPWMKTIARAAGELKLADTCDKIILTGGKTGGENSKSEAELMKEILVSEYHIPENDILLEDKATNTLTNFAFTLNTMDSYAKTFDQSSKVGFLGTDFHLARIRLLAKQFGMNDFSAFSAEQIFKLIAQRTGDAELLDLINIRLNPNEDLVPDDSRIDWPAFQTLSTEEKSEQPSRSAMKAPSYYEKQPGLEAGSKDILSMFGGENRWTAGLIDIPEYWIGYVGQINNNERMMLILTNPKIVKPEELQRLGVSLQESPDEIRKKLLFYTSEKRKMPEEKYFDAASWTNLTREKLEEINRNEVSY